MSTLEEIVYKIAAQLQVHLELSEAQTKVSLIQPILTALGWDVCDPDEVRLEYKREASDNPVDYALLVDVKPVLFIEVKARGKGIHDNKCTLQIIGYAVQSGVKWVVITNGDEYRIFNTHAAVPMQEKQLRAVTISRSVEDSVEVLSLLSKSAIVQSALDVLWNRDQAEQTVMTALKAMFDSQSPGQDLVNNLSERTGLANSQISAVLSKIAIRFEIAAVPQESRSPVAKRPDVQSHNRPVALSELKITSGSPTGFALGD